jgi:hypothetical protein
LKRIKALEDAQSVASVESVLVKIANYGFRREEDFDKYEALRLVEQLAVTARLVVHQKALLMMLSPQLCTKSLRAPWPSLKHISQLCWPTKIMVESWTRSIKSIKASSPMFPKSLRRQVQPLLYGCNLDLFLVLYVTHAAPQAIYLPTASGGPDHLPLTTVLTPGRGLLVHLMTLPAVNDRLNLFMVSSCVTHSICSYFIS